MIKSALFHFFAFVITFAGVMVESVFISRCDAAPRPFPRIKDSRIPQSMVGEWDVDWNGVSCVFKLDKQGIYSCQWCPDSLYVGSWSYRKGCFFLTESSDPGRGDSWLFYRIPQLKFNEKSSKFEGDAFNEPYNPSEARVPVKMSRKKPN